MSSAYFLETVLQQIGETSCVEADQSNLFVGTSDGQLLHFVIHRDDPDSDSLDFTYLLASKQYTKDRAPVKSILLLPDIGLAAIFANDSLFFFTLPEFAPASELRSIKDVQGVLQNSSLDCRLEIDGSASLTVFTKRKIRQVRISRSAVRLAKEVEYSDCKAACQRGAIVCVATKTSYDLIDLDQRAKIQLFPVVQGDAELTLAQADIFRPLIISVTPEEFLLVSGSPGSPNAMGMFITLEGEITRGTLMFETYPIQIIPQYPHVLALLSNNTIEVHDINTQEKTQTISAEGMDSLSRINGQIDAVLKPHLNRIISRLNTAKASEKEDLLDLNIARKSSYGPSHIVLSGPSQICTLLTDTSLLQVDQILDQGDFHRAVTVMDDTIRNGSPKDLEKTFHEVQYVHQRAGLICFEQMLFDDAMDNFTKGNLDPRILISLFPEFVSYADEAKIYAGVKSALEMTDPVESIIHRNLSQSVDDEASLVELQSILKANAIELLRRYLTKFRQKKDFTGTTGSASGRSPIRVVENTLLRILLETDRVESKTKLMEFFDTTVESTTDTIEMLTKFERWYLLARFQQQIGNTEDSLLIWKRLEIGDVQDSDYKGSGLKRIRKILLDSDHDELVWEYGLWLLSYDQDAGIELLTACVERGLVSFRESDLLEKIRHRDEFPAAFFSMLEYFVVEKKNADPTLANELVRLQIEKVLLLLENTTVREAMVAIIHKYRTLKLPKVSYVSYVAALPRESDGDVIFQFNLEKTKALDFLQSDIQYDAQEMLDLVLKEKTLLLASRILLYGRLSQHGDSLNILVHDLKDFDSAEVYCYHGGISLSQIRITSNKKETIEMRRVLFPLLFREYLKLEDYTLQFTRGSELLNRWGNYMDLETILKDLPNNWSIELVSGFLTSSLAQLSFRKQEAIIRQSLVRAKLTRQNAKTYVRMT